MQDSLLIMQHFPSKEPLKHILLHLHKNHDMKRLAIFTLVITACFSLFAQTSPSNHKEMLLDSIMEAHLIHKGKRPVHNFMLYAHNEQSGFSFHKGLGVIGGTDQPIDEDHQYNVASITKMFVATIILQLMEEGKLSLEDKVADYVADIDFLRFEKFHMYNDTAYADAITLFHLLRHTSGIADVFIDTDVRFNLSVLLHKKRSYTSRSIIDRYFKYHLNKKPLNKPGQGFRYSDINYMLLGFTIEQLTGLELAQAIRERILEPLHLENTYFDYYEEKHGHGNKIDAYFNRINLTQKVNTSYEWGGGGLVSTTKETATFITSLFDLTLFKEASTLKKMLDFSVTRSYGGHYGLGIYEFKFANRIFYGHGGFYGSLLLYEPKDRIVFSANIGQSNAPFDKVALVDSLLEIIIDNTSIN